MVAAAWQCTLKQRSAPTSGHVIILKLSNKGTPKDVRIMQVLVIIQRCRDVKHNAQVERKPPKQYTVVPNHPNRWGFMHMVSRTPAGSDHSLILEEEPLHLCSKTAHRWTQPLRRDIWPFERALNPTLQPSLWLAASPLTTLKLASSSTCSGRFNLAWIRAPKV